MSSAEREGTLEEFPAYVVRDFQPEDVAELKALTHTALGENYPGSLFLDIHGWWPEGFIVTSWRDEVIAFIAGLVSSPGKARILMLAVREDLRSRGIGTALMEVFTRRCRRRGLRSIELEVRNSNQRAMEFYKRLGYTVRYLLPRFYTDGEDGYKLWRPLPKE
ncbi:MAG: GNAT family N-acetyltransferase [Candidatus Thermoplasmatota archaeon]|nr:GNAT family N-acetyltransferase [Candidatus Thermoplasmatota archaeon]